MPRQTSKYRVASVRARQEAAARGTGRFGRVRRALGAVRGRLPHPRRRREIAVISGLALAVILGLGSLGGAWLFYRNDHDWTAVANVNGTPISREALRGRINVLSLLAERRVYYVGAGADAAGIDAGQRASLVSQIQATIADPVTAARDSLIADELLRQLAARDGVATPAAADPWAEAATYATSDLARKVRYIRFGLPAAGSTTAATQPGGAWPAASTANVAAATERLESELADGTAATVIVAGLHDAGWQVTGQDVSVSRSGVPSDLNLELDSSIAAATLSGKVDDVLGPTTDLYGRVAMGRLIEISNMSSAKDRISGMADAAKVDGASIQSWANGQALKRAVTAHLLAGWRSGVEQAHFRELVIGAAPTSGTAGPWVQLSSLAVDRVSSLDASKIPGAPAGLDLHPDALAAALRNLGAAERVKLWDALAAAANAGLASGTVRSGDIGYYTKDQLLPDVGKAAFEDKVKDGDVLGPITTASGPQLFLVRSRYSGTLDERATAALAQVRADPAADPATYTAKFSPTDAPLAADAGWRAKVEFASTEPASGALFDTAIGTLSDPFVLDGKLALGLVDQRRTATPDARMADRLTLDGFDAWFATELHNATITRNPTPLPELVPSASPTAAPSVPALETLSLPSVPGLPAATPAKTDALGLPVLP